MSRATIGMIIAMTLMMLSGFRVISAATEIIPLHHRLPAEMAGILAPLLEPGEAVVPVTSGLVVKARPARIDTIRGLVQQLDRPLKHLVLTVLQTDRLTLERLNAGIHGRLALPEGPVRALGRQYRSESVGSQTAAQQLRVLEGQPAYILVGQERPVPVIRLYGFPPQAVGGIEYRPVTTGFQVKAHLLDCRVRLTISPWSKRLRAAGDDSRAVRAMATTVVVAPGQWIELGSHLETGQKTGSTLREGYRYQTRRGRQRIFLRADVLDGC